MRILEIMLESCTDLPSEYTLRRNRWDGCWQEIYPGQRILFDTQAESTEGHGQYRLIDMVHRGMLPQSGNDRNRQ